MIHKAMGTQRVSGAAFFCMLLVFLYGSAGLGSGMEFAGLGTEAAGRGGAFAAKAEGGEAFLYNPAGLASENKRNALLGLQLVHLKLGFLRSGSGGYRLNTPDGPVSATCPSQRICIADPALDYSDSVVGQPFEKVEMSRAGVLPFAVFTWGTAFGVRGLSVSLGLVPPAGFAAFSLPDDGAQRYGLVKTGHFIVFPGVGLAYRITDHVQIGGVFLSGVAHLSQTLKIRPLPSMASTSFNESAGGDALLEITALDGFVPTGIVGILVSPVHWLSSGVSVRLPAMVRADGTMSYEAPAQDMPASYMPADHNRIRILQHFPLLVRGGIRLVQPRFDVEIDVVFENWASLKGFDVLPEAVIRDPVDENTFTDTPMPDSLLPKHFRNTVSLHLGSSIVLVPQRLDVQLGTFYQSSAYPKDNRTFNVDAPFGEQIGASIGLGVQVSERTRLQGSWLHIFQPDVTVKKGIVQQQGLPLSSGENIGNIINSGTYAVSLNVFGFSGEVRF